MKILRPISVIVFLAFVWVGSNAQNTFSVSDMNPHYMDLNGDNYEGTLPRLTFEYSQWINYTTLVDEYDLASFSISVQMVPVHEPKGLELTVEAAPYKGISKGTVGTPTGLKTVTRGARVLIDNITTCYTGSDQGTGHKAFLKFSVPRVPAADTVSYKVSIVYTFVQ